MTRLLAKIRALYAECKKIWQTHILLSRLCLFLAGLLLILPLILLGDAGLLRSCDYLLDDALYQGSLSASGDVVIVTVCSEDISRMDCGTLAAALVEQLNQDPSTAPAVIGLDLPSVSEALTLRSADNVVLGEKAQLDTRVFVGDNDRLSAPLTASAPLSMTGENVGHTNVILDQDGHLRHYLWTMTAEDGSAVPSFAQLCCTRYGQARGLTVASPKVSADNLFTVRSTDSKDKLITYDASAVLEGRADPAELAGKIVLIGFCDTALTEGYSSTGDHAILYPVEFQAEAVDCLLRHNTLREIPVRLQLIVLWVVGAALLVLLLTIGPSRFLPFLLAAAVSDALIGFAAWCLGYTVHFSFMLTGILLLLLATLLLSMWQTRKKQEDAQTVLKRYIDASVSSDLLQSNSEDSLSLRRKQRVAILFADIRGFTSFSESADPEQLVSILNQYFSVVSTCVHDNGGTLDKYIGDCVMAIWGAPKEVEDPAYSACKAALEINSRVRQLRPEIERRCGRDLYFGIGIHYGEAIVGNVGAYDRMDYTAIGDAVNIASRLETMAPEDAIFISGAVLEALGNRASTTHISEAAALRGRSTPVEIYLLNGLWDLNRMDTSPDPSKLRNVLSRIPELHVASSNSYTFHVCGSRGTRPVTGGKYAEFGGHTSCYVLKQGKRAVVIDCGTGLDDARTLLADCRIIDVVMTHVHYDHIMGLLGWGVFPREAQISFYGDFASWLGKDTIAQFYRAPFWPIVPDLGEMVNIPRYGVPIKLPSGVTVTFYRADHPNEASLLYVQADKKRLCIMADCERSKGFPEALLKNCDLLLFDGMYTDEEYPSHVGWGHSTWQTGCRLAQEVTPSLLLITHHDPGRSDKDLRVLEAQARALYPNTRFARSGDVWSL